MIDLKKSDREEIAFKMGRKDGHNEIYDYNFNFKTWAMGEIIAYHNGYRVGTRERVNEFDTSDEYGE